MKDTIIKETGNSRFLRSIVAEDITFAEFIALLRAGQLPIDLAGINEEGIETLGMALSKENLLNEETEVAIWGNADDRTPTAALKAIVTSFAAALDGKIVTGTYTGNGVASRTISLGFTPKAVLIVPRNAIQATCSVGTSTMVYGAPFLATPNNPSYGYETQRIALSITDGGFNVMHYNATITGGNSALMVSANTNSAPYNYIAIA